MDQRNPYNNPHFRNEVQQPDAPEPQNRVQNAVDLLTDPRIPRMRERRDAITSLFFGPDRSGISTRDYQNINLQRLVPEQYRAWQEELDNMPIALRFSPAARERRAAAYREREAAERANKKRKNKWYGRYTRMQIVCE